MAAGRINGLFCKITQCIYKDVVKMLLKLPAGHFVTAYVYSFTVELL